MPWVSKLNMSPQQCTSVHLTFQLRSAQKYQTSRNSGHQTSRFCQLPVRNLKSDPNTKRFKRTLIYCDTICKFSGKSTLTSHKTTLNFFSFFFFFFFPALFQFHRSNCLQFIACKSGKSPHSEFKTQLKSFRFRQAF